MKEYDDGMSVIKGWVSPMLNIHRDFEQEPFMNGCQQKDKKIPKCRELETRNRPFPKKISFLFLKKM